MSASTRSFTNSPNVGSDPNTLVFVPNRSITVDLTALLGATIYRAVLDPMAEPTAATSNARYTVRAQDGTVLSLLGPRYMTFDATAVVKKAIASGTRFLSLNIEGAGQGFNNVIMLNVTSNTPAPRTIRQVTNAQAIARPGGTMIKFDEVDLYIHGYSGWTIGNYEDAVQAHAADQLPKHRYRIYRSSVPFTSDSVWGTAELVDEILPLNGWNHRILGNSMQDNFEGGVKKIDKPIPRLPMLTENDAAVAPLSPIGMGLYVNDVDADGVVYYFVSHVQDGAEDFAVTTDGGNQTNRVQETMGAGIALLWKTDRYNYDWNNPPAPGQKWGFSNVINMRLDYYVRWASPPFWNVPSEAFNYRVGVPMDGSFGNGARPMTVHLHEHSQHYDVWSGRPFNNNTWPHYDTGALLLNTSLNIYNGYTAFNEYFGTLQSWLDGTAQPYFQARLLDFAENVVCRVHTVDTDRIALYGRSMGGAGVQAWGFRSGWLFSHLLAGVGHQVPRRSGQAWYDENWRWDFEQRGGYGEWDWRIKYSNENQLNAYRQFIRLKLEDDEFNEVVVRPNENVVVWDHFNNEQWLRENVGVDTPYISFANAPNDLYVDGRGQTKLLIDWRLAWRVVKAMEETGRPFNFAWGQQKHSQPIVSMPIAFEQDLPLLAFRKSSLNDDIGATENALLPQNLTAASDRTGQINQYLRWNPNITANAGVFSADIWVDDSAPVSSTQVDITLRRTEQFNIVPGGRYRWELDNRVGADTADANGLLTLRGVTLDGTASAPDQLAVTSEGGGGGPGGGAMCELALRVNVWPRENVVPGRTLGYTVYIENVGNSDCTNVMLTNVIDPNSDFVWSNFPAFNAQKNFLSFDRIPAGQTQAVQIVVRPRVGITAGQIVNTATISGNIPAPITVQTAVTVQGATVTPEMADLSVDVASSSAAILAGEQVQYTMTVTNFGAAKANNILLTFFIDPNGQYSWSQVEATKREGTFVPHQNAQGTDTRNRVVCEIPSLARGASTEVSVVIAADPNFSGNLTHTVGVVSDQRDPIASNNTANVTTKVLSNPIVSTGVADLDISISPSNESVMSGESVTYSIMVHNSGKDSATNLVAVHRIDPNATFVWSDTPCELGTNNIVTCLIPQMNIDETKRILVVVRSNRSYSGQIQFSTTVSANESDPNEANNEETVNVVVWRRSEARLNTRLVSYYDEVRNTISYTLIAVNKGSSPLENIVITDTMDVDVRHVWSTITETAVVSGNVIVSPTEVRGKANRLPAGAELRMVVVVQVLDAAATSINNTVVIDATGMERMELVDTVKL